MTRASDAGFTLIETLVALAVLAMSAVALLGATEAHIRSIGALELRAAALWTTENHLAELTLGTEPDGDPAPMLGVSFAVTERSSPTSDPDLKQVIVSATNRNDERIYSRLTGFIVRGTDE